MIKASLVAAIVLTTSIASVARDMVFAGQDYPPFNYEDGGKVVGGMHDIVKKACDDLKHNCTFKIIPLARATKMMEDGEVDGVLSLIANPERAVYSNFSPTIIVTTVSYMGKKGTPKLASYKELSGWTVGGVRASSSLKIVVKHNEEVKGITISEEVNNEALVLKLTSDAYGAKGAVMGSEDVLNYFAKKAKVEIAPVLALKDEEFMVAFGKKKVSADELAAFTKTLEGYKKSGTVKKMLAPYALRTN